MRADAPTTFRPAGAVAREERAGVGVVSRLACREGSCRLFACVAFGDETQHGQTYNVEVASIAISHTIFLKKSDVCYSVNRITE